MGDALLIMLQKNVNIATTTTEVIGMKREERKRERRNIREAWQTDAFNIKTCGTETAEEQL